LISSQHPVLLVAVPLFFAALCPVVGMWKRAACFYWALAGVAATGFLTWTLVGKATAARPVTYNVGGWRPPFGIQIRIDYFGLFMACIITGVALLVLVYCFRYATHDLKPERVPYFYTLFLLMFLAMIGFSITGDIFNMFVFMEIFSITSYALVAITGRKAAVRAAFKYLLMGAISSLTILLAISFLYSVTGSLNMLDISARLGAMRSTYLPVAAIALAFFTVGFAVKAALFPLHVWLPDAHSMAPSPVSALLSALAIKMGVIGILRIFFTVFSRSFSGASASWGTLMSVLSWVAAIAIVAGSAIAIFQDDLKYMIAYSSVSHVGYILLGICMLSSRGMTGGFYNLLAHAMGKACLFLVAGAFIYKLGVRKIADLKGMGRRMPVTAGAFALASLSIVGIPPSAGFIAKFYLVWGSIQTGQYAFIVFILLGSLLSAVYCFRVVYYLFFTTGEPGGSTGIDEAPLTMWAPSAVLALGTLFFGLFSSLVIPSLGTASKLLLR
jgi:multicomponent Na+:H+ antiporter subunit D